jgi:Ca2+-binding EF-hand superfamily protein
MESDTQKVLLVPADMRGAFVGQDKNIRMTGADADTWTLVPPPALKELLAFLKVAADNDIKSWTPFTGVRMGYDDKGIFIQYDHLKHYFGIVREFASIALKNAVPESMPESQAGGALGSSDRIMRSFLTGIPSISSDVRNRVLRAAFQGLDHDGNDKLRRDEMVSLMRRVMPTLSGKQIVSLMADADSDEDGVVDFEDFVAWLEKNAEIRKRLDEEMKSEFDCVKALFRFWDKNGDGLVTHRELTSSLKRTCPELKDSQIRTLCLHLDRNKDDKIDYEEFVEFLFG